MSEQVFDFNSLQKVKRVITRDTGKSSATGILRTSTKNKETGAVSKKFIVSPAVMKELGLETSSLETFKNENGVYLAVCPGNTGDFFKKKEDETQKKSNSFKHNELSDALDEEGFSGNLFTLQKVGAKDSKVYYKMVQSTLSPTSSKKEAVAAE